MTGPALHTISKAGRGALIRIAEAQVAGEPLSDRAVDRRHLQTIEELVEIRPRTRTDGKRSVMDEFVVVHEAISYLAKLGRPDLSRALTSAIDLNPEGASQ